MTILHPIFVPKGYTLYTLPTERYMNYLIDSIKSDNHGSITGGPGRIGKTEMVRCLSNEGKIWLAKSACAHINYGQGAAVAQLSTN